jgi:hypothetical protein
MTTVTVLILDLTVLLLGSVLGFLSYIGYRKNKEISYACASVGFGAVGVGVAMDGIVTSLAPKAVSLVEHMSSVAVILGFGLIIYGGEMAE